MFDPTNAHPLTEFQENALEAVRRLQESGQPEVLTIEGKPVVVVQSAKAYQEAIDRLEREATLAGLRRALKADVEEGRR